MLNIIYCEDNPGDVLLLEEMLNDLNLKYNLVVLDDGEKATNYITKNKSALLKSSNILVLLDVNLPKLDGHRILHHIRNTSKLYNLKVLMVSSSRYENKNLLPDCYVQGFYEKPLQEKVFLDFVLKHFEI